jgi:hypothetical protein
MKALRVLIFSMGVAACLTGFARADDAPGDAATYKQKLHDCVTQMKKDHADMNHEARRKSCRKELGPAPKAPAPASAPAAAAPTP